MLRNLRNAVLLIAVAPPCMTLNEGLAQTTVLQPASAKTQEDVPSFKGIVAPARSYARRIVAAVAGALIVMGGLWAYEKSKAKS